MEVQFQDSVHAQNEKKAFGICPLMLEANYQAQTTVDTKGKTGERKDWF